MPFGLAVAETLFELSVDIALDLFRSMTNYTFAAMPGSVGAEETESKNLGLRFGRPESSTGAVERGRGRCCRTTLGNIYVQGNILSEDQITEATQLNEDEDAGVAGLKCATSGGGRSTGRGVSCSSIHMLVDPADGVDVLHFSKELPPQLDVPVARGLHVVACLSDGASRGPPVGKSVRLWQLTSDEQMEVSDLRVLRQDRIAATDLCFCDISPDCLKVAACGMSLTRPPVPVVLLWTRKPADDNHHWTDEPKVLLGLAAMHGSAGRAISNCTFSPDSRLVMACGQGSVAKNSVDDWLEYVQPSFRRDHGDKFRAKGLYKVNQIYKISESKGDWKGKLDEIGIADTHEQDDLLCGLNAARLRAKLCIWNCATGRNASPEPTDRCWLDVHSPSGPLHHVAAGSTPAMGFTEFVDRIEYGGIRVAAACADKTVYVWFHELGPADGDEKTLMSDGRLKSSEHQMVVKSTQSAKMEHDHPVTCCAVAAVGDGVLSGGEDGDVHYWHAAADGKIRLVFKLRGHAKAIAAVVFGKATTETSTTVTHKKLGRGTRSVETTGLVAPKIALSFSGRTVRVWDLQRGEALRVLHNDLGGAKISACAFNHHYHDSEAVLSGDDGQVRTVNVQTGMMTRAFRAADGPVTNCGISGDGEVIVSSTEKSLRLWPRNSGETVCQTPLHTREGYNFVGTGGELVGREHTCLVTCVRLSPSGKLVGVGDSDGTVQIWRSRRDGGGPSGLPREESRLSRESWEMDTVCPIKPEQVSRHIKAVRDCVFSANEDTLATASDDATIRIWQLVVVAATGRREKVAIKQGGNPRDPSLYVNKATRVLEGHTDSVTCIRLFGHALRAISTSKDSSIRIWSTRDGMCLKIYRDNCVPSCIALR